MKAFIDTSSLIKKYVEEKGSEKMEGLLRQTSEIVVAPTAWVEFNSAISQCLRDKRLTPQSSSFLLSEAKRDFQSYSAVVWNETLEEIASEVVHRYSLATLDAIQLASGLLSKADIFATSDRRLFEEARRAMPKVRLIW